MEDFPGSEKHRVVGNRFASETSTADKYCSSTGNADDGKEEAFL